MKPSEIFGIVVRVFGLSITIFSLWSLLSSVALAVGDVDGVSIWYFFSAVIGILLGLYLLRGAPLLLRFSYPHDRT